MQMDRPDQACGEGSGVLPCPCAPLAYPYIPVQGENPPRYQRAEALQTGTLFPGLNLPFHLKENAANVASTPLSELQALDFVVAELGLYLDTHAEDKEAFALYQQYVALAREGRKKYVAQYGPLEQMDTADQPGYNWLKNPWPWDGSEGGSK